ncbi:MAG: hypothetical protein ACREAY_11405, partial [Nitrososphaera sp.]|uniref:hypothetical protein n=1 Tax=Nitrososphaera sp. TaxID=1971748 RepID=UPI003D6E162E
MTDQDPTDHENLRTNNNNNKRKIIMGTTLSAAIALVLATALPGLALAGATDTKMSPTEGYDIHVTVGRHDSAHLDAQMD